jgi:hypothetical protein
VTTPRRWREDPDCPDELISTYVVPDGEGDWDIEDYSAADSGGCIAALGVIIYFYWGDDHGRNL